MKVAVLDVYNNKVVLIENNGVGYLWLYYTVTINPDPTNIHGADIDDDGDIDLVISHNPPKLAPFVTILRYLKDINGDSLPDMMTVYKNFIYTATNTNTGPCFFAGKNTQYTATDGSVFSSIVAEDINADGDVDLVAANRTNNNIVVLRNKQICCHGTRGNVNWSADDFVDLSDLSALICYLTGCGYVLECPAEADVNGDNKIDLTDLSCLKSYLTGGGYQFPSCPSCGL